MAPDIDGKLYLTDVELPSGQIAAAGDIALVEINKTDAYDLIGRVVEIVKTSPASADAFEIPLPQAAEKLTRISTGAALRVLG
jgi:hypothetical protein